MNQKPLFVASLLVAILAACGLESGGFTVGQAIAVLALTIPLLVWSFMETDWWEGGEKNVNKRVYREHESGDCCHQADKKSA